MNLGADLPLSANELKRLYRLVDTDGEARFESLGRNSELVLEHAAWLRLGSPIEVTVTITPGASVI